MCQAFSFFLNQQQSMVLFVHFEKANYFEEYLRNQNQLLLIDIQFLVPFTASENKLDTDILLYIILYNKIILKIYFLQFIYIYVI